MKSHDKGIEMYKTKFHYRKSLLMQQNELKKKNLSCMVILLLKMHHSLYYKTL